MNTKNKIYQKFEERVDKLIRQKNELLASVEAESPDKLNPRNTPAYRQQEGYRNALIYSKLILRDIICELGEDTR